ncbi:MAG: His-Xaa-Ser system protein HxsD [Prevotellaceae bacterium]|nr:His-Xaa-Ser system protein HxsD [Candidatus Minthosoma caballi]
MNSFRIIGNKKAQFNIDANMFSKSVIMKVLYWLNNDFVVQTTSHESQLLVELESNNDTDWNIMKKTISTMLNDFQMREVIEKETHDIRNILYVKAFSNIDNFTEYDTEE